MFTSAARVAPRHALPRLWLATVAASGARVDALIAEALELDLGPPSWRTASGEILIVLALRRRPEQPERASEILLDASCVVPFDGRVWLAMAVATRSDIARVACLERALELRVAGDDRMRAEVLSAVVTAACALHQRGLAAAAGAMMRRAVAMAPGNAPVSVAATLAQSVTDAGAACAALAALDLALRPATSLLADYIRPQTEADLLQSAARWSQTPERRVDTR